MPVRAALPVAADHLHAGNAANVCAGWCAPRGLLAQRRGSIVTEARGPGWTETRGAGVTEPLLRAEGLSRSFSLRGRFTFSGAHITIRAVNEVSLDLMQGE